MSVEYRKGPPTVEQVQAHAAAHPLPYATDYGRWQVIYDDLSGADCIDLGVWKGRIWTDYDEDRCRLDSDMLWRPCDKHGTPIPWPGESDPEQRELTRLREEVAHLRQGIDLFRGAYLTATSVRPTAKRVDIEGWLAEDQKRKGSGIQTLRPDYPWGDC